MRANTASKNAINRYSYLHITYLPTYIYISTCTHVHSCMSVNALYFVYRLCNNNCLWLFGCQSNGALCFGVSLSLSDGCILRKWKHLAAFGSTSSCNDNHNYYRATAARRYRVCVCEWARNKNNSEYQQQTTDGKCVCTCACECLWVFSLSLYVCMCEWGLASQAAN